MSNPVKDPIKTLFNSFMEICRFRLAPQDLPASGGFLGITIVISALISLLLNWINLSFQHAVLAVLANITVVIIITQLILRLYNKPMRIIQTLTAQFGAGIVISVIATPVIVMMAYATKHDVDLTAAVVLWLGLFIWEIAVTAHILRHALSTTVLQGFLMAILYPLIYFQLIGYLIPTT